ncbi:hypothetical protein [Candidatus Desulfovibrio trichonymphae]|uniref:Lipoprotein n=1 Tax=Candidatus Desulfovibrio trichonymphae TaxID=1725232 RepID=A0A1J1E2V9_9BACT|nr:hypothetical protein [Candidatus Desulfovibrio trichonymphae]BAV91760.1 conserved hypothetical protein [Candidatus Desulfovibrio trichonymphae]
MRVLAALVLGLTVAAVQGCTDLGIGNLFSNDPFTGGSEAATSRLLDVTLPPGMERYPSHGYQTSGAYGGREGLETLRGDVDPAQAAQSLYSSLSAQGWQMRLALRKGDRSVYLYDKANALTILVFRRQTVMTILEIWTGGRLQDGAALNLPGENGPHTEPPGETWPAGNPDSYPPSPGATEHWGEKNGSGIQERNL